MISDHQSVWFWKGWFLACPLLTLERWESHLPNPDIDWNVYSCTIYFLVEFNRRRGVLTTNTTRTSWMFPESLQNNIPPYPLRNSTWRLSGNTQDTVQRWLPLPHPGRIQKVLGMSNFWLGRCFSQTANGSQQLGQLFFFFLSSVKKEFQTKRLNKMYLACCGKVFSKYRRSEVIGSTLWCLYPYSSINGKLNY